MEIDTELEIVSLNWGYIPNFGDRPPKESNAASLQLPDCKKKSAAHKNGFEVLVGH